MTFLDFDFPEPVAIDKVATGLLASPEFRANVASIAPTLPVSAEDMMTKINELRAATAKQKAPIVVKTSTYITGWCQVGGHAGRKTFSTTGALLRACSGIYEFPRLVNPRVICTCFCHRSYAHVESIDLMLDYALSDGSDHVPPGISAGDVADSAAKYHATSPVLDDYDVVAPPVITRTLYEELYRDPHLTDHLARLLVTKCNVPFEKIERIGLIHGRRERGSLDVNVEAVCRLKMDDIVMFNPLTPQLIALMADPDYPISPGAIRNVLLRFHQAGYVNINQEPVYFLEFKGDALEHTTSSLALRMKRAGGRAIRP